MPVDMSLPADASSPPGDASAPPADTSVAPDLLPLSPAVVVNGSNQRERHGSGSGGTESNEVCPGNQVLIGFRGVENVEDPTAIGIQRLAVVCGALTAVAGNMDYPIQTELTGTLTERGRGGGTAFDMLCPDNEVVIRISGNSGSSLDRLQAHCGRLSVASDRQTVTVTTGATLTARGLAEAPAYDDPCPAGQVARGGLIRAGQWVDAFTMICGTPAGVP